MEQIIKFPNIDLSNVKGVLLDLDNTLYYYEDCHEKAIEGCYSAYKKQIDEEISLNDFSNKYREKRNIVTKRLSPQGTCRSRFFAFQEMFEEFDLDKNWELAFKYEEIYWSTLIDNILLTEDALALLKECKRLKIDICVVSDMTVNIQVRKLQKLGVSDYIKYLVTSEEVGEEKPSAKMFKTALKKLKLKPNEVIMIGDSESKDIKGAEDLGIKSYKISIINI
jgi:HAD superfamily hydrolase (TIGR01549 family)